MLISRTTRPTALPMGLRQVLLCHPAAAAVSAYSTSTSQRQQHGAVPPPPRPPPPPPSSVSETEVSHFTALASEWWDPHGSSRILHLMNPLRHTFISRCRASVPSPSASRSSRKLKYLDVGCGGGIFAESAARLDTTASVTAIDPTPSVLAVARKHQRTDPLLLEPNRLTYIDTAIENLPLPASPSDDGVDVLSTFEVVEHVQNPAAFLETCMKHVRPGGWLVLSTMSRTWTSWFTTVFVAEQVLGFVPRGTHDWNQYINVDEMKTWAGKQKGWGRPVTMGVVYVPGVGWKEVGGSESWGNYFLGIRKDEV